MKSVIAKFTVFAVSLILIQTAHGQVRSEAEMSKSKSSKNESSVTMNFGLDYTSNLHEKESSESASNMTGSAGLSFDLESFNIGLGVSYTKELQDLREESLNDASIVFSGFSKQLTEITSISASLVGILALNETAKEVNYFQGAVSIPVAIEIRPESVDWATYYVYASGTKNSHEYETNFDGESNPSISAMAGVGMNISFSDSVSWRINYKISQAQSYGGEVFDPVSGYETALTITTSENMSLTFGLITRVSLYNDQSKLQPAQRLLVSSNSLFTSGIAFTF